VYVERGVSGATPFVERLKGRQLDARLRKGDILVAAKLDRMFRSALDALNVIEDLMSRAP
jgi:DNA invertase Pin-like site-specific DNA recombinase